MNGTPDRQTGPRDRGVPPSRPVDIGTRSSTVAGRRGGFGCWWVAGILLLLIIIPTLLTNLITDWMWFGSQGLAEVYTTRLWLAVGVFFGAGLIATLFCWAN